MGFFGRKNINNPTPHSISKLFDALASVCGILSGFIISAKFVPSNVSDIISPVLTGLCIPLFMYFKSWFGKEVDSTTVKSEEVMEIKDPPKTD